MRHFSVIAWKIPAVRARRVVPDSAAPVDDGEAWVTVASHLDTGTRMIGGGTQGSFEQTDYRLHYHSGGEGVSWLLGTSLGSLAGVAVRHCWSRPWHLSAMELQIKYDEQEGRYRDYRIQAVSQWVSSYWEIQDTGITASVSGFCHGLPGWSGSEASDHYLRRDGATGVSRMTWYGRRETEGRLLSGRCDLFKRLGLLTDKEVQDPVLVRLHRRLGARFAPATIANHRAATVSGAVLAQCA